LWIRLFCFAPHYYAASFLSGNCTLGTQWNARYAERWNSSPVAKACEKVEQLPVPSGEYLFLHDDPNRKFLINRKFLPDLPIYRPSFVVGQSVLALKDVLENAVECHFMDSCMFHLAESLKPKGRLYLHRYPRPYNAFANNYKTAHRWNDVW
jgi:hypothetical protein